jgi:hypothetical protein
MKIWSFSFPAMPRAEALQSDARWLEKPYFHRKFVSIRKFDEIPRSPPFCLCSASERWQRMRNLKHGGRLPPRPLGSEESLPHVNLSARGEASSETLGIGGKPAPCKISPRRGGIPPRPLGSEECLPGVKYHSSLASSFLLGADVTITNQKRKFQRFNYALSLSSVDAIGIVPLRDNPKATSLKGAGTNITLSN